MRLQTAGGYTPAEIRDMTMPEAERLFRSWNDRPPVSDCVMALAIWAGAIPPPKRNASAQSSSTSSPSQHSAPSSLADFRGVLGDSF